MFRNSFWNPLAWTCKKSVPVHPSRFCRSSSLPSPTPVTAAPLRSTAQSSSHSSTSKESEKRTSSASFKAIKAKQKVTARLADRYSRDYGRFYFVPGKVSENQDFIRLYACLAWKIDAFLDDFPEWKTLLLGAEAEMRVLHNMQNMGSYALRDVQKFGPVVNFLTQPQENYTDLWDTVECTFGPDAQGVMAMVDKAIYLFIKYSDDLIIVDSPEAQLKQYSLEEYIDMSAWTGGAYPLASCFWFGIDSPKNGQVEDACTACSLVNDLYDYPKDHGVVKQLRIWHYFATIDNAVHYVRDYYYEIYDRVGRELQHFLDLTMTYQQEKKVINTCGPEKEWFRKLNSNFSRHLARESQQHQHNVRRDAPPAS